MVVARHSVGVGPRCAATAAANVLIPAVRAWAGSALLGIQFSGSFAKGTAISLGTDVDLFLSLDSKLAVKDLYWGLHRFCAERQMNPQAQDVSVGVRSGGMRVDLVPGRRRTGNTGDHTLYRRRKDSWVQTNVEEHVSLVAGSGRTNEIRAAKIWRERNRLEFPSFYLELTVMGALRYVRVASLAERCMEVLRYLAGDFEKARVVDPANSNNVISDDVDQVEKRLIAAASRRSLTMGDWSEILW